MKWWTSPEALSRLINWVGVTAALLTCATAALKFRYDALKRAAGQPAAEEHRIPTVEASSTPMQTPALASHPKTKVVLDPFREKLRKFCDGVDTQILTALASGNTRFRAHLYQDQLATLRELADEPGAQQYLKFEFGQDSRLSDQGMTSEVLFELDPSLLVP